VIVFDLIWSYTTKDHLLPGLLIANSGSKTNFSLNSTEIKYLRNV
jgi:hypothetical protein